MTVEAIRVGADMHGGFGTAAPRTAEGIETVVADYFGLPRPRPVREPRSDGRPGEPSVDELAETILAMGLSARVHRCGPEAIGDLGRFAILVVRDQPDAGSHVAYVALVRGQDGVARIVDPRLGKWASTRSGVDRWVANWCGEAILVDAHATDTAWRGFAMGFPLGFLLLAL